MEKHTSQQNPRSTANKQNLNARNWPWYPEHHSHMPTSISHLPDTRKELLAHGIIVSTPDQTSPNPPLRSSRRSFVPNSRRWGCKASPLSSTKNTASPQKNISNPSREWDSSSANIAGGDQKGRSNGQGPIFGILRHNHCWGTYVARRLSLSRICSKYKFVMIASTHMATQKQGKATRSPGDIVHERSMHRTNVDQWFRFCVRLPCDKDAQGPATTPLTSCYMLPQVLLSKEKFVKIKNCRLVRRMLIDSVDGSWFQGFFRIWWMVFG